MRWLKFKEAHAGGAGWGRQSGDLGKEGREVGWQRVAFELASDRRGNYNCSIKEWNSITQQRWNFTFPKPTDSPWGLKERPATFMRKAKNTKHSWKRNDCFTAWHNIIQPAFILIDIHWRCIQSDCIIQNVYTIPEISVLMFNCQGIEDVLLFLTF